MLLYRRFLGHSPHHTHSTSHSRTYNEFHEIDKTTNGGSSQYDVDTDKHEQGLFSNHTAIASPGHGRKSSKMADPWGDAIPLSTAQATAQRGGRDSEEEGEERVMGITKTVGFNVEAV